MGKNLLAIAAAITLLLLGELLPNYTKKVLVKKGENWKKVILISVLSGLAGGLLSAGLVYFNSLPKSLNPIFIPFATTILSYLTAQAVITDSKVFLINRNLLRVAYIPMYIISLYNVITSDVFMINRLALLVFTLTLIFIFIFVNIGPSDVRMMAVGIPFIVSIGGYNSIVAFSGLLLALSAVMYIKKAGILMPRIKELKNNNPEMYNEMGPLKFNIKALQITGREYNKNGEGKKAVGPYMTLIFLIYLIAYPIFI